jgi:hypothetical protein
LAESQPKHHPYQHPIIKKTSHTNPIDKNEQKITPPIYNQITNPIDKNEDFHSKSRHVQAKCTLVHEPERNAEVE